MCLGLIGDSIERLIGLEEHIDNAGRLGISGGERLLRRLTESIGGGGLSGTCKSSIPSISSFSMTGKCRSFFSSVVRTIFFAVAVAFVGLVVVIDVVKGAA